MAEYGWEPPVSDLTWCSTSRDSERAQFKIRGQKALRTAAAVGFKVLGTMLTFDNKLDVELEYRLTRANNAFFANGELLWVRERTFQHEITRLQSGGRRISILVRGILEFDQGAQ